MPVIVQTTCLFCGKQHETPVGLEEYQRWRGGEHIQNVWPDMTTEEREILISGTCPKCWDIHMGGDGD